jgi:hypothetical protein
VPLAITLFFCHEFTHLLSGLGDVPPISHGSSQKFDIFYDFSNLKRSETLDTKFTYFDSNSEMFGIVLKKFYVFLLKFFFISFFFQILFLDLEWRVVAVFVVVVVVVVVVCFFSFI